VYAVATELFFASPHGSANTEDPSADPVTLARRLPLVEQGRGHGIPALASDIARNYRGLLVGTRA
jgi:hypothetical protein